MEMWLNDTSVDGFLGNLRNPESFIKMDSKWNASLMTDTSKPPSEDEGGTIVEDAVGLLNRYEYVTNYRGTIAGNGYLKNVLNWVMLTPYDSNRVSYVDYGGNGTTDGNVIRASAIRPSINLRPEIKIVAGNGTEENPYRLMGDNDSKLYSVKLNTRYSGEYIKFGIGVNNLYRIVSHETDDLTKIVSAEPLKENGAFKTLSFGDNVYYSSDNIIGNFLNGEYLTSGTYLTSEQVDMIEDNTTWFLGAVGNGANYRLAKYTDTSMGSLTPNVTLAKVGLLRLGELMTGQFNSFENNTTFWILTSLNSNSLRYIASINSLYENAPSNSYGIKPSMNLKSNVIITSGTGTKSDPFEIELSN